MRTVEILQNLRDFLKAEPYWDGLVLKSGETAVPFVTFDWLRTWWEAFGDTGKLFILVIKQDGIPVCALPLIRKTTVWRGIPCRSLCCVSVEQGGRTGLIGAEEGMEGAMDIVLRYCSEESVPFDMFLLDGLPEGSSACLQLDALLPGSGLGFLRMPGMRSPYIVLKGTWEQYLKTRSRNMREKIRRMEKSVTREGRCVLRRIGEKEKVGKAMDAILAISRKTWKYREGTAIASAPRAARFYRRYAEHAAQRNMLKLLLLEYDGTPVAFTYEIEYLGKNYFVKTGFDSSYSRLSPGIHILASSIREAFHGGCREYDLLGSDEEYKMRFTDLIRPHYKYRVFNRSALGMVLHTVEKRMIPVLRRLVRGIRGSPEEVTRRKPSRSQLEGL